MTPLTGTTKHERPGQRLGKLRRLDRQRQRLYTTDDGLNLIIDLANAQSRAATQKRARQRSTLPKPGETALGGSWLPQRIFQRPPPIVTPPPHGGTKKVEALAPGPGTSQEPAPETRAKDNGKAPQSTLSIPMNEGDARTPPQSASNIQYTPSTNAQKGRVGSETVRIAPHNPTGTQQQDFLTWVAYLKHRAKQSKAIPVVHEQAKQKSEQAHKAQKEAEARRDSQIECHRDELFHWFRKLIQTTALKDDSQTDGALTEIRALVDTLRETYAQTPRQIYTGTVERFKEPVQLPLL